MSNLYDQDERKKFAQAAKVAIETIADTPSATTADILAVAAVAQVWIGLAKL